MNEETKRPERPWTPGPWEKDGKNVYAESWQGPMNANGCVSVGCNTDERPLSVLDANARLVACAPELFEALKTLTDAISGHSDWHFWKDEIEQAESALAKALGGQP